MFYKSHPVFLEDLSWLVPPLPTLLSHNPDLYLSLSLLTKKGGGSKKGLSQRPIASRILRNKSGGKKDFFLRGRRQILNLDACHSYRGN